MNILILCTGNSARSILAEAALNHRGGGRIAAYSAGSKPKGEPHPEALALLEREGVATAGLSSKSWEVFAGPDAPAMDLVITVCDSAAAETCPVWPGAPLSAHWGVPDPVAVTAPAEAVRAAFETAYRQLGARIDAFLALPWDELNPAARKARLAGIGAMADA